MYALWLILGTLAWLLKPEQSMRRKLLPKDVEDKPSDPERAWEEYKLYAEFYKFFLDFGLKANVFFYGITGAILTVLYNRGGSQTEAGYVVGSGLPPPVLKIVLMTPFFIGVVLAAAFIIGAVLWFLLVRQINNRVKTGELSRKITPYLNFLTALLLLFGGIFGFVSICLYQIMGWHRIVIW
jgi:hypothetical protein